VMNYANRANPYPLYARLRETPADCVESRPMRIPLPRLAR
jgi:hypothetical protein